MTARAEDFLRLMREALQRAADYEREGEPSKAKANGKTAAAFLRAAIRLDA